MSAALPYGAREIIALRNTGKRPADMVLVSLIGPLREINPVVVAQANRAYDWRFLADLEVLLVANSGITSAPLRRLTTAFAKLTTGFVGVWIADMQAGAWQGARRLHPLPIADCLELAGIGFDGSRDEALALIAKRAKARAIENASRWPDEFAALATSGLRSMFGSHWGAA